MQNYTKIDIFQIIFQIPRQKLSYGNKNRVKRNSGRYPGSNYKKNIFVASFVSMSLSWAVTVRGSDGEGDGHITRFVSRTMTH